ncbi:Glutamate racemase [Pseudomonas fluorescens]|uniref:Glutamate racemase n=1 Tax=Pseudomonas fluorescens TaxID=294 RepID=A0A5E7QSL2_PSEFL|nr:glutamate racemase [Pseudomonas fluorescens]VVP65011.1 Glutamate racemase [Pseudomonas fluorescens]
MNSPLSNTPKLWLGNGSRFDEMQMLKSKRPIVVVDSGVGGLTVVRELEKLIPNANILYLADNAWFPYGSKTGADVVQRVEKLLDGLCTKVEPEAIVVACNTASVAIVDHGAENLRHKCFLVTPQINEAVDASKTKCIAFLATAGTLKSNHVIQSIARSRVNAAVWPIATQTLVTLAEEMLAGGEVSFEDFEELICLYLTEEQRLSIDTVVLGCTHFPLLIDGLRRVFPAADNWIHSARKVALQVVASTDITSDSIDEVSKVATYTRESDAVKYHQVFSMNGFC